MPDLPKIDPIHEDELRTIGVWLMLPGFGLGMWALIRVGIYVFSTKGWSDAVSACTSPLGILMGAVEQGMATGSWLSTWIGGVGFALVLVGVLAGNVDQDHRTGKRMKLLEAARQFAQGEITAEEYHRITLEIVTYLLAKR
jgi:uncharacterized membrane protein